MQIPIHQHSFMSISHVCLEHGYSSLKIVNMIFNIIVRTPNNPNQEKNLTVTHTHLHPRMANGTPDHGRRLNQLRCVHPQDYKAEEMITRLRDMLLMLDFTFQLVI